MKISISLFIIVFLVCSGCANSSFFENPNDPHKESRHFEKNITPDLQKKICNEFKNIILSQYIPRETVLNLVFNRDSIIGPPMVEILKQEGFGRSKRGLETIFTIRRINESLLLSVSIGNKNFSRAYYYEVQTGELIPESSVNIRTFLK